MKKIIAAAMVSMLAFSSGSFAEAAKETAQKEQTPLQIKAKACRAEAKEKGIKGDARKAYVKECTKTEREAAQAERKKKREQCKAKAKKEGIAKGDARKEYMKACMKS